jgi:hypothetical protein
MEGVLGGVKMVMVVVRRAERGYGVALRQVFINPSTT